LKAPEKWSARPTGGTATIYVGIPNAEGLEVPRSVDGLSLRPERRQGTQQRKDGNSFHGFLS
jgi:hypothetical protein